MCIILWSYLGRSLKSLRFGLGNGRLGVHSIIRIILPALPLLRPLPLPGVPCLLRVERFLDRSELAERADLNKRTIEQLETGHYPTGWRLSTIRRSASWRRRSG